MKKRFTEEQIIGVLREADVDVEASVVSKTAETNATQTMIERVEEKFSMKPKRLVGDTNYGTAAMLGWLVEQKGIAPHIPVWDKSGHKDGTFDCADFIYDAYKTCSWHSKPSPA